MKRQDHINKIVKYSSRFVQEVKSFTDLNLYDAHIHSENFLIPILNKTFDINLENINQTQKKNYPAIDLADFDNRVAFQITSTSTLDKVTTTLTKFFRYRLQDYFDVIYIFILTEKQKSYSQEKIDSILEDDFCFVPDDHIIDNSILLQKINYLSLEKLSFLSRIYEHEFSDIQIESREKKFKSGYLVNSPEKIYCNILNVSPPKYIYSAELFLDKDIIMDRINEYLTAQGYKTLKSVPDNKMLKDELHFRKIYSGDYILRNGRFYTFRNLKNTNEPYLNVLDKGTIESELCEDFYIENKDKLNIFVNILRNSFIQDCFFKQLEWVRSKNILRFRIDSKKKGVKKITWIGKKKSTKTVIFELINKKEGHLICYRHLAFEPSFKLIDDEWYLLINPTWSFTNPGGKKTSRFEEDYLSGVKRLENNNTVYYFYRFWSYYLCYKDLFSNKNQILDIKPFSPIELTPSLDDSKWLPSREDTDMKKDISIDVDNELSPKLFD